MVLRRKARVLLTTGKNSTTDIDSYPIISVSKYFTFSVCVLEDRRCLLNLNLEWFLSKILIQSAKVSFQTC